MTTFGKLHQWWGYREKGSNYYIGKERSISKLKKFEIGTRINECVHTPAMIGAIYWTADNLANGRYMDATLDLVLGVALNAYCVMLQRYNRARVYNTVDKITEEISAAKKQD